MDDMMKMYGMPNGGAGTFPLESKLVLNAASDLIRKIDSLYKENSEKAEVLARQIFSLSLLSQRKLTADELSNFLSDSYSLLTML